MVFFIQAFWVFHLLGCCLWVHPGCWFLCAAMLSSFEDNEWGAVLFSILTSPRSQLWVSPLRLSPGQVRRVGGSWPWHLTPRRCSMTLPPLCVPAWLARMRGTLLMSARCGGGRDWCPGGPVWGAGLWHAYIQLVPTRNQLGCDGWGCIRQVCGIPPSSWFLSGIGCMRGWSMACLHPADSYRESSRMWLMGLH